MLIRKTSTIQYVKNSLAAVLTVPMGYHLCFLVLFILFNSVVDYIFTIRHISLGLTELNPVMDYLFNLDIQWAFLFKYFMTAAGLFLLCSLSQYILVTWLITGIAALYSTLTLYHLYLFCLV